ncbi:exosome complex RNA-binding protein Csl4 [Methanolobus chelungpuianus]|nr:exosome complex RNA-binding protein Csl4 [Methanolobus chelungpuianus]
MLIRIRNRRKTSRRKIKSSTSGDVQASEVDTSVEAPLARAEPAETKKAFNQKAAAKKAPAAKSGARKNSAAKAKAKAEEPEAEKIKTPPVSGSKEEYKMDAKESVFVMPGDLIGTTEEFTAGKGTYVDVGDIHSIGTGYVHVDRNSRVISVLPKTKTPPQLSEGDIVVGSISNIRESVVLVEIGAIKGKGEREFQMDGPAAIHVSNVRDSYVKNLSQEFSMSDIVKARVINTQNMRLSTAEESLGVMRANCSRCRTVLEKDGNKLKCPSCGYIEKRKLSSDYGTGII